MPLTLRTTKAVGFLGGSRKSISGIRSSPKFRGVPSPRPTAEPIAP
jgi:hypothetical protein